VRNMAWSNLSKTNLKELRILAGFIKAHPYFNPLPGDYWPGTCEDEAYVAVADVGANILWAWAYPVFRRIRFDQVAIVIHGAGGAGAAVRIGIYESKDKYPTRLIMDFGEFPADTTGLKTKDIDLTLDPGLYFLALVANDDTIDLRQARPERSGPLYRVSDVNFGWWGYRIEYPYGPLPDPFPEGASLYNRMWKVMLRVAEIL